MSYVYWRYKIVVAASGGHTSSRFRVIPTYFKEKSDIFPWIAFKRPLAVSILQGILTALFERFYSDKTNLLKNIFFKQQQQNTSTVF